MAELFCKRHSWANNGMPFSRPIAGSILGTKRIYWPMRCTRCNTTMLKRGDTEGGRELNVTSPMHMQETTK
jgi:hypothetical protein